MPTHDPDKTSKEGDQSPGYETTDANVNEVGAFLIVLAVAIAVVFVLAFGMGGLINATLIKRDGPVNKWNQLAGAKPGNMESDPQIEQQQLQQMVKRFPTPRLQNDDGNFDVAQMHAREDIFLNHYSWVDPKTQVIRIPIARAMQVLAQRGLPVEGQSETKEQAMFGDGSKVITAPLTDGFARTGPELEMIQARQQRLENGSEQHLHAEMQHTH